MKIRNCLFKRKQSLILVIFMILIFLLNLTAYADEWQTSEGGMDDSASASGMFAYSGYEPTPVGTGEATVTAAIAIELDTSTPFLQGEQVVAPFIFAEASEEVEFYIAIRFGNLTLYYDPNNIFNPWVDEPAAYITSIIELQLFSLRAGDLAAIFPSVTYVPFGIFVRAVEVGSGVYGTVIAEQQATTFFANLPAIPDPPSAPW